MKRLAGFTVFPFAFAVVAGCGGGGGSGCPTCGDACKYLYETCKKSETDMQGNPLTQEQCVTVCGQTSNGKDFAACIPTVKDCSDEGLLKCVQNPPAANCGSTSSGKAPHQPHGTITGAPVCLDCHAQGASSNAPKVPDNHKGKDNSTCMGCHGP